MTLILTLLKLLHNRKIRLAYSSLIIRESINIEIPNEHPWIITRSTNITNIPPQHTPISLFRSPINNRHPPILPPQSMSHLSMNNLCIIVDNGDLEDVIPH